MLAVITVVVIYEGERMYNPDEKSMDFFFIIIIYRTERIRHTFPIDTTLMRVDKDDMRCLKDFSRPLGPSYAMQRMHEKDTLDPLIAQPQRLHIFIFTCHKESWIFELFYAST